MTDPDNLDAEDHNRLRAIIERSPRLAAVVAHVRDFATMMRNRTGARDLPQWIERVEADALPGLQSFVNGIRADLAAVTNGVSLPYSSGPVEGHVNDQASDVRQSKLRPPAPPHPRADLSATITELVPEPFLMSAYREL